MPDDNPTDPGMTNQDLQTATEATNRFTEVFEALGRKSSEVFSNLSTFASNTVKDFSQMNDGLKANVDGLEKIGSALFTIKSLTGTENIFGNLEGATTQFGNINSSISAINNNIIKLTDLIPGVGDLLGKVVGNLKENASAGQQMEAQFLNILSASGQLGQIFGETGQFTGDLAAQTLKYAESLGDVADASGMTLRQVAEYAGQLGRIPGILTENVNVGSAHIGNVSALTAALKVLSGSGQNLNEVFDAMNKAYTDLGNAQGPVGNNVQKGLDLFSRMVTLSQDLNLQFKDTKEFLGSVADQFKFVGDNTEAASRVLQSYIGALKETGLTGKASLEVVNDMVSGVHNLTTAQKAYLSLQSGGPGGLQGSLQIEQLMRTGQTDQVLKMVEDTLKRQFGGRIVTQAEGATSQESAAEFTRQRMFLTQGVFGSLTGGNEEKATRLLEALASGDRGVAKEQITPLQRVAEQGNSIQEKNNTVLTTLANIGERTAIATQITALNTVQRNFGGEGAIAQMRRAEPIVSAQQGETVTRSSASVRGFGTPGTDDLNRYQAQLTQQLIDGITNSLKPLKDGIGGTLRDAYNAASGGSEVIGRATSRLEEERNLRRIQNNIPPIGPTTTRNQTNIPNINQRQVSIPSPLAQAPLPIPMIPTPNPIIPIAATTQQAISTTQQVAATHKIDNQITLNIQAEPELKRLISIQGSTSTPNQPNPIIAHNNAIASGEPGY